MTEHGRKSVGFKTCRQFAHQIRFRIEKQNQRRFDEKKTTCLNTIKHDASRDVTGKNKIESVSGDDFCFNFDFLKKKINTKCTSG